MTISYDPTYNGIALPVTIVSGGGGSSTTTSVTTLYTVIVQFTDGIVNNVGDTIQEVQLISSTGSIISTTWTNLTQNSVLPSAPSPGYISAASANPLTNAQLRASPVPMSTTQLPTTLGLQTAGNSLSVVVSNPTSLDNFPVITQYVATAASTGVNIGDYVQDLQVYDAATNPATLVSSVWTNITQNTTLTGAPPASSLTPISGTGLTNAQLRASPIKSEITDASSNVINSLPFGTEYGLLTATSGGLFIASAYNATYPTLTSGSTTPTTVGWENTLSAPSVSVLVYVTNAAILNIGVSIDNAGTYSNTTGVALTTGLNQFSFPANGNYYEFSITNSGGSTIAVDLNVYYGTIPSAGQLPKAFSQSVTLAVDQAAIQTTGFMPASIYSGQKTLSTSASALSSLVLYNGVVLTASSTNTGTVYVGGSTVTTSTGYALIPGQSISYAVSNQSSIYVVGTNTTDTLYFTGN
jgi:hypothetical protein